MIRLTAARPGVTLEAEYECMAPAAFKASELRADGWYVVIRPEVRLLRIRARHAPSNDNGRMG